MAGAHLLIVEDEEFIRQLVAAYLEKEGYRLSVAGSAKAMHDVLDREQIDLIVLDLGLPDEDGLTLIRQLRTRSAVPIVVLTARQTRDDRITALGIGADDYVTKPVDPQELTLRIANLLRRSGGRQSEDAQNTTCWRSAAGASMFPPTRCGRRMVWKSF